MTKTQVSPLKELLSKIENRDADLATKQWIVRVHHGVEDILHSISTKEKLLYPTEEFDSQEEAEYYACVVRMFGKDCSVLKQTIGQPRRLN